MATTINAVVRPNQKKSDGTFNVKLRIIHQRKSAYLTTSHYVKKNELDKEFRIKQNSPAYIPVAKDLEKIRNIIGEISFDLDQYSINELVEIINKKINASCNKPILIKDFSDDMEKSIVAYGTKKYHHYTIAKALRFFGEESTFKGITPSRILEYERYLRSIGNKESTINYIMKRLSYIFKCAREKYNDEDNGIFLIPNPFSKYHFPKILAPKKRSWDAAEFKKYIDRDISILSTRRVIASDIVIISFLLCGANCADIYEMPYPVNGYIHYFRKKTRNRRDDGVEMIIKAQPELLSYISKYEDPYKKRAFNFYLSYDDCDRFSDWICGMIKHIRRILSIPDLTTYVARHTWATIAYNDLRISKDDIAFCLIHASNHKITEFYIKPDYMKVDDINRKVIDWVYYGKKSDFF